jgi:polyisoprenoid-binding protein YceI
MTTLKTAAFLLSTSLSAALVGGVASASEWTIDGSHTTAGFSVRHMMLSTVRGAFEKVSGTLQLDDKDISKSKLEVVIDAASINTREPKRDAHLKSPDFFDVAKTPTITFKSTKVEKGEKGKLKVTGDLTMHGQTHPVTLTVDTFTPPMKNPWGVQVRGVSATGKLNRKEWGLNWNKALEAGGMLVGEEIDLQIDAELNGKATQSAAK